MAEVSSNDVSQLAEGNAKFTNAIYNLLRETPGNLFFSPLSIEAVLALAHGGAGGNTAAQLEQHAHLPANREASAKSFSLLMDQLKSNKDVTLNLANALYADIQFQIKPDYLSLVEKGFKSELGQVDFKNGAAAAQTINSWVAKQTKDKIPTLFEPAALTPATKLVLINAIYFKGNWLHKFPATSTKKGDFHLNEKDTKEVDFMTIKEKFVVSENDESYIVEVPYVGGEVSMILVVPKSITGLSAIEKNMADMDLSQLLKEGRKKEIILTMPKFKLEKTMELNDVLVTLGLGDLFDENRADLSGISDVPLYVSKAIQKSFIEVNEEGSEAAAATGIAFVSYSLVIAPPPIEINANRPYQLYIRHKPSDLTLFVGRYAEP